MNNMLTTDLPTYYKSANGHGIQVEDTRICVVMVGLPARGKSLIAQKGGPFFHYNRAIVS